MSGFNPRAKEMARSRGQILYRFRPQQTFDHPGGFTAQVRQIANDDGHQGDPLDTTYVVEEAMRLVHRWRSEGRGAEAAEAGSDRAPEFPGDDPLAHVHYEVVIPGKVLCRVWPLAWRCASPRCGLVWEGADPGVGDPWPPSCPRCKSTSGNRQLQYVFVHACGEMAPMLPKEDCPEHHRAGFRLNDKASRFMDFRWECMKCRAAVPVRAFCPNRAGCRWKNKQMSPQVHTSSAAFVGQGRTLVNVPREEFSRIERTPAFIVATIGQWLGVCTKEEAARILAGPAPGAAIPDEVLESIGAMEATGVPALMEKARKLRARFAPADLSEILGRVTEELGYDPLADADRGRSLAANLSTYERVLQLPRLDLARLQSTAATAGRAERYAGYEGALRAAGFDPQGTALVNQFPVMYIAVGYSRGGFGPTEADLVAYKGRAKKGTALTNLIYANPTETEALVFVLDQERVAKWLIANGAATEDELREAGGPRPWFATRMGIYEGQLPPHWNPDAPLQRGDPEFGPRAVFGLLHSMAHQVLRALAVDSGFNEAALSEYLFPFQFAFAVHPNGGSEFTIGGLRAVLEQNLDEVVARAMENDGCIYDPNCMVANRGADHGCLQLPETACQSWNWFLSRWDLFGAPDGSWTGYWDPRLEGK